MNCWPCVKKEGFVTLKDDEGGPSGTNKYETVLTNSKGKQICTVNVTHETAGQHTLVWADPIHYETQGRKITCPPGNMNCYGFPMAWVEGMNEGKTKPLEGDEYKCICEV